MGFGVGGLELSKTPDRLESWRNIGQGNREASNFTFVCVTMFGHLTISTRPSPSMSPSAGALPFAHSTSQFPSPFVSPSAGELMM